MWCEEVSLVVLVDGCAETVCESTELETRYASAVIHDYEQCLSGLLAK